MDEPKIRAAANYSGAPLKDGIHLVSDRIRVLRPRIGGPDEVIMKICDPVRHTWLTIAMVDHQAYDLARRLRGVLR